MTLDQLRYFVAAANFQHIHRAAQSVPISASVISNAVKELEEEFRCELFHRRGRTIELTHDGQRLFDLAKTVLCEVDGLKGRMRSEPESLSGKYRLAASHFLSSRILLQGWSRAAAIHPAISGEIFSMNTAHAIAEVLSGRIDLALCISPLKHPDLRDIRLLEGEMVVVVRKGHSILKRSKKDQIKFLAEQPAAIHKAAQGVDVCETHPVFDRLGFQPKIRLSWDSDDVAIQRVLDSDDWSFVPDIVLDAYSDQLEKLKLPRTAGGAPYHVSAVVHRERAGDRGLQELIRVLGPGN